MQELRYRPDIDGLRAIAVIPVVLFHAHFGLFSGGYVGVDVFFVISGYLITSIIASEIDGGIFSISRFYQRRIRRIFPALLAVMFFCILVGYAVMTPSDYKTLGESIIAASLFVSNIFFWRQAGYFAANANAMPLLHTWSLAIEEQFYLIFPLALFLMARHARRLQTSVLVVFCILSFVTAAVLVDYKPRAAFFLGFSRGWELLVGCLLALKVAHPWLQKPVVNSPVALIGLALVLVPMCIYSASTPFPGFTALPPVVGTALLILTGSRRLGPVFNLLSARPFVEIGKASYSLYLWHLPLLAFASYLTMGRLSASAASLLCVASLAISFVSLRFIELPFRRQSTPVQIRRRVVSASVVMLLAATIGGGIVLSQGVPMRLDAIAARILDVERDISRHHMECMSLENKIVPPSQACKLGTPGVEPSVLLWGDSHAVVTATALEAAARRHDSAILFAASVDCPIGIGFSISPRGAPGFVDTEGYQYCAHYNGAMLDIALRRPEIKAVVLSSRWSNWRIGQPNAPGEKPVDIRLQDTTGAAKTLEDNRRIFARGFEKLIQKLTEAGKVVWIVGPVPPPGVRVPQALFVNHLGFGNANFDVSRNDFDKQNRWIEDFFDKIAKQYPIKFIQPSTVLCHGNVCPISEKGHPMFFDDNHLSVYGATMTSSLYDRIFDSSSSTSVGTR